MKLFVRMLAALGLGRVAVGKLGKHKASVMGVRDRALGLKAEDIGLNQRIFPKKVWGILMETGHPDGFSFTLLVMGDGTTSLYISSGGGMIGAGDHEQVRRAAAAFLAAANNCVNSAKPVSKFPLPAAGQVVFYFLTFNGVHSYSAPQSELEGGTDELTSLFHTGHQVLSEVLKLYSLPSPVSAPSPQRRS